MNGRFCISIRISLKFIPKGPIDNTSALVQVKAWHRTGDKPLPEPMLPSSLMHICGSRGKCVSKTGPSWLRRPTGIPISKWILNNIIAIKIITCIMMFIMNTKTIGSLRYRAELDVQGWKLHQYKEHYLYCFFGIMYHQGFLYNMLYRNPWYHF